MQIRALLALSLLLATAAWADTEPPKIAGETHQCDYRRLCNAQTATGNCTVNPDGSGDEYVLDGAGLRWVFYATQSTATTFSCVIRQNETGFDVGGASFLQVATPLTQLAPSQVSATNPFRRYWINCSSISGGAVTVTAYGCK